MEGWTCMDVDLSMIYIYYKTSNSTVCGTVTVHIRK
jgi:hypothetical protein